ncbi:hypothetical protein TCAL_13122 [Tigriopus californicus]|uniref:1-alkyl-2-acetylglycerophosphocholine esterase n=1 Tax=Tigriopus californicus TaxID=6832 RepID=A0A553PJQ0_TIGCA|nr:platelet-activating factor acetylhydrolase-like [Tigriopus californicus]TRY77916.1 hypothetical protein TCAL_13122 [Tigriopus californicus]|eukprot:TCALIF_13122-PA protein Name:"Similar to PLA2G7 Platelet-activating factor acetylhydrolase (Homo sapiens)" AED:0.16 eAED:0.16 QI:3/1/1/1/0.33/0.5/4/33/446
MPFWRRSATTNDLQQSGDGEENLNPNGDYLQTSSDGKRHLPQPRGPHSVGFVEVLTPGGPEEGTLCRILYPTQEQCLENSDKWPLWLEDQYINGMLRFMQYTLADWPSWAPRGDYYGIDQMSLISPFIPQLGFATMFRLMNGIIHIPILEKAIPDTTQKWPLVVFSHGLGCSRAIYSRVCYDMASYGFVVAAVEHREGSGCASFYVNESGEKTWIHHKRVPLLHEYQDRNQQIKDRVQEVVRTLDLITDLVHGNMPKNLLETNEKLSTSILEELSSVIDLSKPGITGHSMGGATTVLSLATEKRFKFGIALDAWMFPLRDEPNLSQKLETKPLMFISTDGFRSKENIAKISEFQRDDADRQFHFIKGSVHQNHLDVPFILKAALIRKVVGMASKTCPEIVIDLNNKMMVQFLWKHLGLLNDKDVDEDIKRLKQQYLADLLDPNDLP